MNRPQTAYKNLGIAVACHEIYLITVFPPPSVWRRFLIDMP